MFSIAQKVLAFFIHSILICSYTLSIGMRSQLISHCFGMRSQLINYSFNMREFWHIFNPMHGHRYPIAVNSARDVALHFSAWQCKSIHS